MEVSLVECCGGSPLAKNSGLDAIKEVEGSTPSGVSTVAGIDTRAGEWGVDPAERSTNGKPEEPPLFIKKYF